jgi:hypothetical protein
MPIDYQKNQAIFSGVVSIDDTEELLQWLLKKTSPKINLVDCTHLHPAILQVLMVAQSPVTAWPSDAAFCAWIEPVLLYYKGTQNG